MAEKNQKDPPKKNNNNNNNNNNENKSSPKNWEEILKVFESNSPEKVVEQSLKVIAEIERQIQTITSLVPNSESKTTKLFFYLLYAVKTNPNLLHQSTEIYQKMVGFLKNTDTKLRKNSVSPAVLACNILYFSFKNTEKWPIDLLRAFLEDSCQDRLWCDAESCRGFVEKLSAAFSQPEQRFDGYAVKKVVLEIVPKYIKRNELAKSVIRVLPLVAHYPEIRVMASALLDSFFFNPQTNRFTKELVNKLVVNCQENTPEDQTVLFNFLKLKVKGMPSQITQEAIFSILKNNPEYPKIALKYLINTEYSQKQQTQNKSFFSQCFKLIPDAGKEVGIIFQELALANTPSLRSAFRKFSKSFPSTEEVDYKSVTAGLLEEIDTSPKDFVFIKLIVELTTICQQLKLGSFIEQIPKCNPEKIDFNTKNDISKIQMMTTTWLFGQIQKSTLEREQGPVLLRKILYLEPSNQYFFLDGFSLEAEKMIYKAITQKVPLQQETLTSLISAIQHGFPLSAADCLDIIEVLTKRDLSCDFRTSNLINNVEIIQDLFKISFYYPPANRISEEESKTFPRFVITKNFWKVIVILIMLSCSNPDPFGKKCWDIPCIRTLIEMTVMKRLHEWPGVLHETQHDERSLSLIRQEDEYRKQEIQDILRYETVIAKKEITLESSLLVSQILKFEPYEISRKPTPDVLSQLARIDMELRLGLKLISKNPHSLTALMKVGTSQSKIFSWLGPIIRDDPDILDALPTPCFGEILINIFFPELILDPEKSSEYSGYIIPLQKMIMRLNLLAQSQVSNFSAEIVDFFLKSMANPVTETREKAKKIYCLMLATLADAKYHPEALREYNEIDFSWFKKSTQLVWFPQLRAQFRQGLSLALEVETSLATIATYIKFVYDCALENDIYSLILVLSKLFQNRRMVSQQLLQQEDLCILALKLFQKGLSITNAPDAVVVNLNGQTSTLSKCVVNGIIELFTFAEIQRHYLNSKLAAIVYQDIASKFFSSQLPCLASSPDQPLIQIAQALNMIQTNNSLLVSSALAVLSFSDIYDCFLSCDFTEEICGIFMTWFHNHQNEITSPDIAQKLYDRLSLTQTLNPHFSMEPWATFLNFLRQNLPTAQHEMEDSFEFDFFIDPSDEKNLIQQLKQDQAKYHQPASLSATTDDMVIETVSSNWEESIQKILQQDTHPATEQSQEDPYLLIKQLPPSRIEKFLLTVLNMASTQSLLMNQDLSSSSQLKNRLIQMLVYVLKNTDKSNHGLVIDCIQTVDPNLSQISSILPTLFDHKEENHFSFIPFVLSLCLHNGSDLSRDSIIDFIIYEFKSNQNIDHILNFVNTSSNNSKLTSPAAITKVVELICTDAKQSIHVLSQIDSRFAILEQISKNNLSFLITHLIEKMSQDWLDHQGPALFCSQAQQQQTEIPQILFQKAYFSFPNLVHSVVLDDTWILKLPISSQTSQLELILHEMVKRLRTSNTIHTFRKIAIQYPSVVLKNLPALFSLLLGVFEEDIEQSFGLIQSILQIIELLRPQVFYEERLVDIVEIYFKILSSCPPIPKLTPILIQFVNFISFYKDFLSKMERKFGSSSAYHSQVNLLNSKVGFFKEIAKTFPEITQTIQLIDAMEKSTKETQEYSAIFIKPFSEQQIFSVSQSLKSSLQGNRGSSHYAPTQNTLDHLTMAAEHSVHLLEPFFVDLIPQIFHCDEKIRVVSYQLLLKYLYFEPRQILLCAPEFLRALQSTEAAIVQTAIRFAPEVFFLLTDHQSAFLLTLFQLGKSADSQLLEIISNLAPVTLKYLHM